MPRAGTSIKTPVLNKYGRGDACHNWKTDQRNAIKAVKFNCHPTKSLDRPSTSATCSVDALCSEFSKGFYNTIKKEAPQREPLYIY